MKLDKIVFIKKYVSYPGNGIGLNKTFWKATAPGTWFIESVCSEIDPVIDKVWGDLSPSCGLENDFWNARWEGYIDPLF